MFENLLDQPQILSLLFYPRPAQSGTNPQPNVLDGHIPIEDDIHLGYRLYRHTATSPLILFFHGNGEVASDYDSIADFYLNIGLSLMVVDYRGYGWSTGRPLTSKLTTDAEVVLQALPELLTQKDITTTDWFVMGRSLGSAPAVHLAYKSAEAFKGLIIESGFADTPSIFKRLGIAQAILRSLPEDSPIGNYRKMKHINLPLLVIHGQQDNLLPVENGQTLYDASPSDNKTLLIIPQAGHNDILFYGAGQYFKAVAAFVKQGSA